MTVARSLVATMKLGDQYKALLPTILLRIKPVVTQERPELESDYDLISADVGDLYAPYYNEMLEQAATVALRTLCHLPSSPRPLQFHQGRRRNPRHLQLRLRSKIQSC